jgi:hypothetical protein
MAEINSPYELELFLSTDGKHTVHTTIHDITKSEEALSKARTLYDKVVEKYGLQPTRSGGFQKKQSAPKQSAGECLKHHVPMFLNKNSKPYHMDRTRPEGDQFCNGMGFQGEKKPDSSWADQAEEYFS